MESGLGLNNSSKKSIFKSCWRHLLQTAGPSLSCIRTNISICVSTVSPALPVVVTILLLAWESI